MVGILFSLITMFVPQAHAHPVTFKGGTMLKSMFREDMSENSVTYSFHRAFAVGAEMDRLLLGEQDTSWLLAEFNVLLKRWNMEEGQANVYLSTGAGSVLVHDYSEGAGKASLQVDYETRQFYTLAQYSRWFSETFDSQYYVYRIGMAPFKAGYNDLNVWAILQTDYNKDMRKNVQVTPFLRFYYKNILWELGSSFRGNFYGQFMVHM